MFWRRQVNDRGTHEIESSYVCCKTTLKYISLLSFFSGSKLMSKLNLKFTLSFRWRKTTWENLHLSAKQFNNVFEVSNTHWARVATTAHYERTPVHRILPTHTRPVYRLDECCHCYALFLDCRYYRTHDKVTKLNYVWKIWNPLIVKYNLL